MKEKYLSFFGNVEYDSETTVTDDELLRCPKGKCLSYSEIGMTHYDADGATVQLTTYGKPRTAVILHGVRVTGRYLCPTP